MPISKIKTGSITADSITEAKIADAAIENEHLNSNIITGLSELAETAADADFSIIFDTSAGTLKKILKSNISPASPTISSVSPTNVNSTAGSTAFTITGTGFTTGSSARLIGASGQVKDFTTVVRNSTTQITGTIDVANLDEIQTPYGVQVTNGSGVSALLASQIDVDQAPAFVTASGSLGNVADGTRATASFTIVATDPDSTSVVQYEISSGSLPTGMSLNQTTGVISGTPNAVGSDTTSTFTIRAYDTGSNVSTRSFNITILAPVFQSFTTSGTFSVPVGVTAVNVLVVGGGGSGGTERSGGGGGGGLIFRPGFPVTPGGTVSVTVGCGGVAPSAAYGGANGQDSLFGTLTAKGGGGGEYPGGSGGGGNAFGGCGGTATQPTQPGDSGTYGFGNAGGQGFQGPQPGTPEGIRRNSGGGGGSGAAGIGGSPACGPTNSNGGIGRAYTIADGTTPVYYAGGGGGGDGSPSGNSSHCGAGTGGQGGGGTGGTGAGPSAPPGLPAPLRAQPGAGSGGSSNTGGGGGGGGGEHPGFPSSAVGGTGGKGIVIVQY